MKELENYSGSISIMPIDSFIDFFTSTTEERRKNFFRFRYANLTLTNNYGKDWKT
jgi:hypothetical protein